MPSIGAFHLYIHPRPPTRCPLIPAWLLALRPPEKDNNSCANIHAYHPVYTSYETNSSVDIMFGHHQEWFKPRNSSSRGRGAGDWQEARTPENDEFSTSDA